MSNGVSVRASVCLSIDPTNVDRIEIAHTFSIALMEIANAPHAYFVTLSNGRSIWRVDNLGTISPSWLAFYDFEDFEESKGSGEYPTYPLP